MKKYLTLAMAEVEARQFAIEAAAARGEGYVPDTFSESGCSATGWYVAGPDDDDFEAFWPVFVEGGWVLQKSNFFEDPNPVFL